MVQIDGFNVKMDICAFTHEHPGTRRNTIHPRTLTTTLTQNTSNHCISVHIWISLETVCFVFSHRRADFERISCSKRAPKRRRCRLKRRSCLRERRRPTRLLRCPGRSTCRWKVVIRTLELLCKIREFLEDFSENGVSFTLSRTFSRSAEEMLARLALGSGQRISSTSLACYVAPVLNHLSRHVPPKSGLPLHGQCSPRCCVARSLTRFVAKRLHFYGGLEARFKVHRLYNLVLSQPIPTDVSSHSMADSRDKLHLTRHHPIHAQNSTIKSHSTAQVPCSRLASTCSDVSSRPPCFEIFVMEGHMSTISQFKSNFCARRINATREFLFLKIGLA